MILGFGKEGQSTYNLLRKHFKNQVFTVADINENAAESVTEYKNLKFILGKNYLEKLVDFDLVIKSPGISLKDFTGKIKRETITSQTDIFLRLYGGQTIGITGTKGKSTTSSLLYHIVKSYNKNTLLTGNIGIPPFDIIDSIDKDTIVVFEMSSHQLEYITASPHIAVLLNLYQEHLDHYNSFEDYQFAKLNIAKYQHKEDYFIYNNDDELVRKHVDSLKFQGNHCGYSFEDGLKNEHLISKDRHLKGSHNVMNILAVINACKILNIPDDLIAKGISEFRGLEHRIEYAGKYDGIYFYNDSIATIPEAAMEAVKALEKVDTIILGGHDRGVDYLRFAEFLSHTDIRNFIFIDKAGKSISEKFEKVKKDFQHCYYANDLQEAVKISKERTRKEYICLLSPAAASYGMFKNFEERGAEFKRLIRN